MYEKESESEPGFEQEEIEESESEEIEKPRETKKALAKKKEHKQYFRLYKRKKCKEI